MTGKIQNGVVSLSFVLKCCEWAKRHGDGFCSCVEVYMSSEEKLVS